MGPLNLHPVVKMHQDMSQSDTDAFHLLTAVGVFEGYN